MSFKMKRVEKSLDHWLVFFIAGFIVNNITSQYLVSVNKVVGSIPAMGVI